MRAPAKGARELGVGLDGPDPVAHGEAGDGAVLGAGPHPGPVGQGDDLVLVHGLEPHGGGPAVELEVVGVDPHAPAHGRLLDLPAQGLGQELVAEADAGHGDARGDHVPEEVLGGAIQGTSS